MTKKYFILLIILTLLICLGFVFKWHFLKAKITESEKLGETVALNIGNMTIKYPSFIKFKKYGETSYDFDTKKLFFNKDESGSIKQDTYFPIKITYLSGVNSEKLSVKDWWNKEGPQNDRQAPSPDREESIIVNGVESYKTTFTSPIPEYHSYYYDVVYLYIPNGSDIYKISGYQLPININPDLTPEEIKSAQEYEKILNQVINSFKFTN